jgi:hypothetical protein
MAGVHPCVAKAQTLFQSKARLLLQLLVAAL